LPDWTILFVEPQDKDRKEVLRLLKEEGLRILKKTKKRIYFED